MTSQSDHRGHAQALAKEVRDFATAVSADRLFDRALHVLRAESGMLAPIKGVALHRCVYATPHERPLTDVDLLVAQPVYKRALARLCDHGFSVVARGTTGHTLVHKDEALALDLHYRLFRQGMFALRTPALFARAGWLTENGRTFRMLHDLDMYGSLLGHFVKSGLGPKDTVHLLDLVRLPQARHLDPADVAEYLIEHGLSRAAHTVLPLVCEEHNDTFSKHLLAHLRVGPVTRVAATLLVRHRETVNAWSVSRRLWPYAFDRDAKHGVLNATRHASAGALRRLAPRPLKKG